MNRWPFREALEHYYLVARERALAQYRYDLLKWTLEAPYVGKDARHDPPERPGVLGAEP